MNKEREAFEAWATDKFPIAGLGQFEKHNNGTYLQRSIRNMYEAWQAAKAQAVPDGFVLLPVDTLEECLDWAHIAKWDSPSNDADKKIAHHEAIIESAISAQEPAND